MRKSLCFSAILLIFCLLVACSETEDTSSEVLILTPDTQEESDSVATQSTDNVDVDLTVLSSTMVYAEVFNMVTNPDDYIGKCVKAQGEVVTYQDPETQIIYYAVLIMDATACCSQGVEFKLNDSYADPEDYPTLGETVTVIGEFETYEEYGMTYCRLKEAILAD